jgi:hypothetical protein
VRSEGVRFAHDSLRWRKTDSNPRSRKKEGNGAASSTDVLRGMVGAFSDRKSEDDGGQRAEFVADALLERAGFEPSVPRRRDRTSGV